MISRTIKYVDQSFGKKKPHFERTLYWLLKLEPNAPEYLQVAAYGHDIERAFAKKQSKYVLYKDPNDLIKHQEKSAELMFTFLVKSGMCLEDSNKARDAILKHEEGGTDEQKLIKDADSISYLEVNAPRHVSWLGEVSYEDLKKKNDWMFNRITSKKAKAIAKPFYDKACNELERARNNE